MKRQFDESSEGRPIKVPSCDSRGTDDAVKSIQERSPGANISAEVLIRTCPSNHQAVLDYYNKWPDCWVASLGESGDIVVFPEPRRGDVDVQYTYMRLLPAKKDSSETEMVTDPRGFIPETGKIDGRCWRRGYDQIGMTNIFNINSFPNSHDKSEPPQASLFLDICVGRHPHDPMEHTVELVSAVFEENGPQYARGPPGQHRRAQVGQLKFNVETSRQAETSSFYKALGMTCVDRTPHYYEKDGGGFCINMVLEYWAWPHLLTEAELKHVSEHMIWMESLECSKWTRWPGDSMPPPGRYKTYLDPSGVDRNPAERIRSYREWLWQRTFVKIELVHKPGVDDIWFAKPDEPGFEAVTLFVPQDHAALTGKQEIHIKDPNGVSMCIRSKM